MRRNAVVRDPKFQGGGGEEGVREEVLVRQRTAHIGDDGRDEEEEEDASWAPATAAAAATTMATAAATVNGLAHRPSGRRRRRRPLLWQLRTLLAPRHLYGPVKATMLADGHAVAAGLVVAAVLANHIRRVLAPWLGQFLWWHPVQMMRLARGAPHFFIEQQLRSATDDDDAAAALGLWALQTGALAATRALLRHRLLLLADDASQHSLRSRGVKGNGNAGGGGGGGGESAGRRRGGSGDSSRARSSRAQAGQGATASLSACLTDCCRIIYLTLCIMHAEYAYAEACWAASWLHAATHVLFRGTTAERQFTYRLLLTGDGHDHLARVGHAQAAAPPPGHWRGMSLIASLLLWWLWRVLRPFRRHGVVGVALSGLPIFGGLVGVGTAHVVRYSNKYFIWLEMSEMLLTWVWLALGLALVAVWRLCDQ